MLAGAAGSESIKVSGSQHDNKPRMHCIIYQNRNTFYSDTYDVSVLHDMMHSIVSYCEPGLTCYCWYAYMLSGTEVLSVKFHVICERVNKVV